MKNMQKRLLFAALSSSLVLASYAGFVSAEEETEAEVVAEAVTDSAELSDDIYSFQIKLDDVVYTFPMSYADFIANGWKCSDDETTELAPNMYTWATFQKGPVRITCDLVNFCANSLPLSSCDVAGISIDDRLLINSPESSAVLPGGITYGTSTVDDIVAAYGPASDTYEGSLYTKLTYRYASYQDIDLSVDLETGVLNDIDIQNLDPATAPTASMEVEISDEVPESVLNYKTPEALSDNIYDYVVEFAGDLYQLPCPVSVFLANGWTLKTDSAETVEGKGSGWAYMMKDNQELRVLAKNYEANITAIENCFVREITSDIYTTDLPIMLSKGLTRGMTSAELEAALDGLNYEIEDSSSHFKYYNVLGEDGSKLDGYQFCVDLETDTVINVNVAYAPKKLGE